MYLAGGILEEQQRLETIYQKANTLNRFIARFIDLLIVWTLLELIPKVGFFAGLTYMLIGDGFEGKSIGKRLIGLRVILIREEIEDSSSNAVTTTFEDNCNFKESIIRNFPFGIGYLLFNIPLIGWVFPLIIFAFEGLLIIGNEKGMRIGDEIAKTQVIDNRKES